MAKEKQTKHAFKNVKKKFKNDALIERNSLDRQLDNMESILLFFSLSGENWSSISIRNAFILCLYLISNDIDVKYQNVTEKMRRFHFICCLPIKVRFKEKKILY